MFEVVVDSDNQAIRQCLIYYRNQYKNLNFSQKKEIQYSMMRLIHQYEKFRINFVYTPSDQKIKLTFTSNEDYILFLVKWSS